MKPKLIDSPPINLNDIDLDILRTLYSHNYALSASQIQMQLTRDGLSYAYPSIFSKLKSLERKGYISQISNTYSHSYAAVFSIDALSKFLIKSLHSKIFG